MSRDPLGKRSSASVVAADQYASGEHSLHSKCVESRIESETVTVVSVNTRERETLTRECEPVSNGVQARTGTHNDMAGIMFQQQEVFLGPSVGPQPDQSVTRFVASKRPSPLQLSKLLHSPMQRSPQLGGDVAKESPLVGSMATSTGETTEADVVFDCDEDGAIPVAPSLENGECRFHLKV